MKTDPLKKWAMTENSWGQVIVTRAMVYARAAELAVIDGRAEIGSAILDYASKSQKVMIVIFGDVINQ